MRKSPNRLTHLEAIKISEKLKEVCHLDSRGYAFYDEGWSDELVADEFDKVSALSVKRIRQELIGEMRHHRKTKVTSDVMASLCSLVLELCDWAEEVEIPLESNRADIQTLREWLK